MKIRNAIHSIDPRVKIVCALLFIFLAVSGKQNVFRFSSFFFILLSIAVFFRVPLLLLFKRSLVIIPFVVVVAVFLPFFGGGETVEVFNLQLSVEGLERFKDVVMKGFLSVFCASLLVETTEFQALLKGFEKLKMPTIMVILISFTYRYFTVILDEAKRMKRARDTRSTGGTFVWQMKTLGSILGQLFVRSYERSERVYQAMVMRGFAGEVKILDTLQLTGMDIVAGLGFCILVGVVRVIL
jgi:cobalt/nickel transport system permease protein